jgi:tripartite-type tricarboxylate transporter receptor subunit TctC
MQHRLSAIALATACTLAAPAVAQTYPSKPVRIIVGATPGGGTDFVTRLMGGKLGEALGQQIIVDNRPGAGSVIGFELGVKAAPDGYTLTMISPSYAVNPSLYPIKYDALTDYTPIIWVARGPFVLVVHPSLPAHNVKDLIALAKGRPGEIIYASSGQGGIVHLAAELFLFMAGAKMTHVPYRGGGPAITDLIAGQVQLLFSTSQVGMPHVKSGRLRALGVTTTERMPAEPALPTIAEAGLPGYDVPNWHGLIGPRGLPRAIVDRLNTEMNNILRLKEMEERLQSEGVAPAGGTPERLHEQVRNELQQWRQVVQRAGIKLQ